jgi:putative transcriptional regulator
MSRKGSEDKSVPRWLEGHFLISEADLSDPNFTRTVVLIVHHNEEGAFGLVLNRRLDVTLGQVSPDFSRGGAGEIPIYYGGPVQPQYVFCLHSGLPEELRSEHAAVPVQHVVFEPFVTGLSDYLRTTWSGLPDNRRPPIHLYSGYSGWAPGQLEAELARDSWVVRPAAAKHIFHPNPEEGWREALGELGGFYRIVADTGFKPSMN